MLEYRITENKVYRIENLVLDFNGTIAVDGKLIPGVRELLNKISESIEVHIITADTFGSVRNELLGISCKLKILVDKDQISQKKTFITELGKERTVSIGNGRNDSDMVKESAIGICLVQNECAATETLLNSDIVSTNIIDALETLLKPDRIKATLRY
ncbi:MAG: ATPase P [Candidatus Delongbacteria bacterium]|nr:ATPase P [Candidatus Delongbacteria bacterium]